jgi:hypothetical protein
MFRRTARTAALLAALSGPVAIALPADACGGLFCRRAPVDQNGERILFAADGKMVTAYVQIQYQGSAEAFSWIVPVPTTPKLSVGSDAMFTALRATTRPQFNLDLTTEGECKQTGGNIPGVASQAVSKSAARAPGVEVVNREQVGAFDAAVLDATDAEALKKWLRDNDYEVPAKVDPLLDPYVAGKYKFVALKLANKATTGDIQPIVMRYESTKPGIPIRLTGVAATPDMNVFVWVLGQKRAVPENYRHAQINEARIDWLGQGQNYPAVVTEAMNESGGQAFVTDYAGDSRPVNLNAIQAPNVDFEALRQISDPAAFVEAVRKTNLLQDTGAGSSYIGFLARYVKKPEALKDVGDDQFFRDIGRYEAELKAEQIVADGAKAAEELEERYVTPAKEVRQLFETHPYMTALYTTMSPDEMTQDPMFVFNGDLPEVSNMHEAKGVRKCSGSVTFGEAPIEITLANGTKYMISGSGATGGSRVALPAAARIEQMKTEGGASIIKDNKPRITATLGEVNGGGALVSIDANGGVIRVDGPKGGVFGCLGCAATNTPPISEGSGEFAAYGLVALGFLGYRLELGRRRRRR